MLRGTRPTVPLVASIVVLAAGLAACGNDTPGTGLDFGDRLDVVTVAGDIGAATIEFEGRMEAGELEAETPIKGTGEALADDDKVFVDYAIGNGFTQMTSSLDSFGDEATPVQVTVGAEAVAEPQTIDDVLTNLIGAQVKAGVTKGSRIVLTGSTEALFGDAAGSEGLTTAGIGNDDGLVMVLDVSEVEPLESIPGEGQLKTAGWAPKVTFDDKGVPTFDFEGLAKPDPKATKVLFTELETGDGPAVAAGDLLVVDYIGYVYDGKEAFQDTYAEGMEPAQIPAGQFTAEGFNETLEGKKVGSRIIMRIPPGKGFGEEAQGDLIPANSTLYFLVDILAAV